MLSNRCKAFAKFGLPIQLTQRLSGANIDEKTPLQEGSFGIVFIAKRLLAARGTQTSNFVSFLY